MVDLLILVLFSAAGTAIGVLGIELLPKQLWEQLSNLENFRIIAGTISALLGLIAGILFQQLRKTLLRKIRNTPTDLLVSRSIGLILGLLVANLVLAPILLLPLPEKIVFAKPLSAVVSNILFGLLGYNLADIHGRTLLRLFNPNSTEALLVAEGILTPATAKIIDTSVIIDGRITSLLKCGLTEGQIIIAQTVIDELQKLADSSNNEKRAKGRRGLSLLKDLRETYG